MDTSRPLTTNANAFGPGAASRVSDFRARLEEIRQQIRQRFRQGATGLQVASSNSERMDALLVRIAEANLATLSPADQQVVRENVALVAVGGTGRGDLAPYSDIDLLVLYHPAALNVATAFAGQVVRDCWDTGLKLGHSIRTVADSIRMAREDVQFATSLLEARPLWGKADFSQELTHRLERGVLRPRAASLLAAFVEERNKEQQTQGSTVQQLEPDVKRSLGGLRDVHLIRWISRLYSDSPDPESLRLQGYLNREELLRLVSAYEFLTWIRINLHLHMGKPHDVLARGEQMRIADELQFAPTTGQLPVERFMQEYFRHTSGVAELAERLVRQHRPWSVRHAAWRALMTYRVDEIYRVGPDYLQVPPRYRSRLNTLEKLLRLYWSAAMYSVPLAPELEDFVRLQAQSIRDDLTVEAGRLFLDLLSRTNRVGWLLRSMYRTGILELVIPPFRHVRCLLQFNQYHSYTVDEHTLRAVEAAEQFQGSPSHIGGAFREIRHREILYLAILLHDAGKGFEDDHSEVGKRLADTVARRFRLSTHNRELLVFLVHQHLSMAHLAFRRDISDPEVLYRFTHDVGSVDRLRLLYVLTAADITAVGPGVWNDWKAELLQGLYEATLLQLSGNSDQFDEPVLQQKVVQNVVAELSEPTPGDVRESLETQVQELFETFPRHYLQGNPDQQIASDVRVILDRAPSDIHVQGRYNAETDSVEYRVITHEDVAPGCFHKIAGTLTARRMEILSAQITTTTTGIIIDSYRVQDTDHDGEVPGFRLDEVCDTIRKVLRSELDVEVLIRNRSRRVNLSAAPQAALVDLPIRVVIDNESSDQRTLIDVFAHDRPGLLYTIGRSLFEMQLSVELAKISTHLDQVVDVFYLTDRQGVKITDPERLRHIEETLRQTLQDFEVRSQEAQQ